MSAAKQLITRLVMSFLSKTKDSGRPYTVIVEGNIGSGKTTFLQHFSKHRDVTVLAEPVDAWRNIKGNNLLSLLYEDPKKWSFTFQSYAQVTMLQNHTKQTLKPIKMIERSVYSARYCFVERLLRDGLLPAPSAAVLDHWFQWIIEHNLAEVDLVVYLRTTPEVVYERILKRKRPEERTVSMDYLKSLHDLHEEWLFHKTLHKCPAPTLVLNADLERSVIKAEFEKWEPQILNKGSAEAHAI
ncbi:deoxynucleoside kinase-like [Euwallacea fornicatus]|uniref:deoxynucleoside kinase-like n=1 Tax=Euwallacea fornicatus TaxID=995702 RepID=UPI00338EAF82